MASKEAFLNNIAQRLGRKRAHEVKKPKWNRHPWDHLHQGMSQTDLVGQFETELTALGGEVIRAPALDQLPEAISQWLETLNAAETPIQHIVSWDHSSRVGETLKKTLQEIPTRLGHSLDVTFWDEDREQKELVSKAEKADVGFTVAEQGLSETGTVVLYNRGNCSRLVSLMPTICATILSASTIVPRLTQFLEQAGDHVPDYSCINLITGPSRSADIEMDLSIGVHGPGQIVIFLVEDL